MARVSKTINSSYILLVEGEADRGFLEQVCKKLNLNPEIKPAIPKDYQADYDEFLHNGKQAVRKLLNDLLPDLVDEESTLKRLAAIVDADYAKGLGFQETLDQFKSTASEHGFIFLENNSNGLIFKNGDLMFGLWIMPNNQDEGMLEHFIKKCIKSDDKEQELFNKAAETIQTISEPKFDKTIHLTKAEIATWLAWQKTPGHGFYVSVKDNLLQTDHALFQELEKWLKHIFI